MKIRFETCYTDFGILLLLKIAEEFTTLLCLCLVGEFCQASQINYALHCRFSRFVMEPRYSPIRLFEVVLNDTVLKLNFNPFAWVGLPRYQSGCPPPPLKHPQWARDSLACWSFTMLLKALNHLLYKKL